jgi:hypothetical protein
MFVRLSIVANDWSVRDLERRPYSQSLCGAVVETEEKRFLFVRDLFNLREIVVVWIYMCELRAGGVFS